MIFRSILLKFGLTVLVSLLLAGCLEEEKVGLSYHAYNHTDNSIVAIAINNQGGVLNARAHGEGGGVCCVVLPKKWRSGLMATIKWQEDDIPIFNPDGTRMVIDGVPAAKESPWKERTVEVPKYSVDELDRGTFYMHFFPNEDVKVLVATRWAGFEGHPYPHPDGTKQQP